MTLYELIDNWHHRRHLRRMSHPHNPADIKAFIGLMFLAGYYIMVWQFSRKALPTENLDLIRDAMLTLGPPVGAIVAALFRSDTRDEQQTRNTGEAFRAMGKVAESTGSAVPDEKSLKSGDTVTVEKEPDK